MLLQQLGRVGDLAGLAEQPCEQHRRAEALARVELAGHGLAQAADRHPGLHVAELGRGEIQQGAGAAARRRWLVDRAPQIERGGVRGAAGGRQPGGRDEPLVRPRVAGRLAAQQLRGDQLGRSRLQVEQPRGARVVARAAGRAESGVDGGAHQRVDELERVQELVRERRAQDAGRDERVDGLRGLVRVDLGEPGRRSQRNVAAEDRNGPGEPHRGLRQSRQPRGDLLRDALGALLQDALGVDAAVAPDRRARQLAQQERVPTRRGVAGAALRVVGARREPPDHGGGAVLAQRLQVQQRAVRRGVAAEHLERRARLLRPARHDQRDGDPLEPVRDVDEHVQRRRVAPVDVVDEQRQRPLRRQVRGQPVEGVPRGERVV